MDTSRNRNGFKVGPRGPFYDPDWNQIETEKWFQDGFAWVLVYRSRVNQRTRSSYQNPKVPTMVLAVLRWDDLVQEVPRGALQALPLFPR